VREDRMATACAELRRRGHPVLRVPIEGTKPGLTRDSWAIRAQTDEPVEADGRHATSATWRQRSPTR
jgi:hypothetical protein